MWFMVLRCDQVSPLGQSGGLSASVQRPGHSFSVEMNKLIKDREILI